jgi:hypothetical protein
MRAKGPVAFKKQSYLKKVRSQTRTKVPIKAIMQEFSQLMEPSIIFDSTSKLLTAHKKKE